jgi:predicted protein tyrosine phosphatase
MYNTLMENELWYTVLCGQETGENNESKTKQTTTNTATHIYTKKICQICGRYTTETDQEHNKSHMVEITESLYLGGIWNAHNSDELVHFKIGFIINAAYEVQNKFTITITYKKLQWDDTCDQNILDELDGLADLIDQTIKSDTCVLVHCYMGRSRSVSVIIAYLIKYHHMNYEEALNLIRTKRESVCPNEGFQDQLNQYWTDITTKI